MRKRIIIVLIAFAINGLMKEANSQTTKEGVEYKNMIDTVSYIIGTNIGTNFKQNEIEINMEIMQKGMKDAISGAPAMFNDSIVKIVMSKFQKEMMSKQDNKRKEEAEKHKKEGEKFLSENRKKKGVVVLPSGLQYKIIKEGKGEKPIESDMVKVHYKGNLIDGTVFDSSYDRNEPATFPVNQVIKGWTEALKLMNVGSEWELYIPEDLAYGDRPTGNIPAGSTLIFKVELLSIEKKEENKEEQP